MTAESQKLRAEIDAEVAKQALEGEQQRQEVKRLVKMGQSAVTSLMNALSNPTACGEAASALAELGAKDAVPQLVGRLVQAGDKDERPPWADSFLSALRKLGVQGAALKGDLGEKEWPVAHEINSHTILTRNEGGPAFRLRLSLGGQAVGRETSLVLPYLLARQNASSDVSIRPSAAGEAVPLHWRLVYDDINGIDQELAGTEHLVVKSRVSIPSVSIGTVVQGSVDGVVVGKVNTQQEKPFTVCPYCGEELNLPKTPRFCPYCKEKLAENA